MNKESSLEFGLEKRARDCVMSQSDRCEVPLGGAR